MLIILLWAAVFIASLSLLVFSSDKFVDAAKKIGTYFRWPEFVIGVIIVGIGTSLPELASCIAAVINGSSDIVVSNVLGSNITNITLVFGIAAFGMKSFKIKHDVMKTDLPFLLVSSAMVALMIMDRKFTIPEAALCTAAVFFYVFRAVKTGEADEEIQVEKPVKLGFWPWFFLFLTPAGIAVGAHFTVEAVIKLSELIGIGTEVIAVTAVALGTSLPEVMVSIQAVRKGNAEIAVGNVIGSNIFNSLAVMGIPGIIGALIIPPAIISFIIPMFIATTAIMILIVFDKRVFRFEGFMLLLLYVYFIGHLYGGF